MTRHATGSRTSHKARASRNLPVARCGQPSSRSRLAGCTHWAAMIPGMHEAMMACATAASRNEAPRRKSFAAPAVTTHATRCRAMAIRGRVRVNRNALATRPDERADVLLVSLMAAHGLSSKGVELVGGDGLTIPHRHDGVLEGQEIHIAPLLVDVLVRGESSMVLVISPAMELLHSSAAESGMVWSVTVWRCGWRSAMCSSVVMSSGSQVS